MRPDRAMRGRIGAAPASLAGALILGMTASATIAAIPAKRPQATTTAPVTADATIAAAAERARAGDCAAMLRMLDPLVARGAVTADTVRTSAQLLRMPCLLESGRSAEATAVLAELRAKAPTNPLVLGYQVFLDIDAKRYADAADHLAALADSGSPALGLLPGDLWLSLAQQLTLAHDGARRDRTGLALARAGWSPQDRPDLSETIAVQAIGTLLDTRDLDEARPLLARVLRPTALWDMAIERRFEPLWPEIETRLGPASGTAADRYAARALDAFAQSPDDDHARAEAVRAFAALGRADDVIATAAPIAIAAGMDEDRVDIVLGDAEARAAGGDHRAAVARLAPFATLDLAATPEAAGALIALAEADDDAGLYDDELAVARRGLADAAGHFSAYGIAWLRRDEACALAALHRDDEARAAGDRLKVALADNQAAAVEGLLCAGREDEAAAIAVAALATSDGADRLADQFQPPEALFLHPRSRLRALWQHLLARPQVRAAFDRAARLLPDGLRPAAEPRPIPLLPGATDNRATT